jgi:hypothetical protein
MPEGIRKPHRMSLYLPNDLGAAEEIPGNDYCLLGTCGSFRFSRRMVDRRAKPIVELLRQMARKIERRQLTQYVVLEPFAHHTQRWLLPVCDGTDTVIEAIEGLVSYCEYEDDDTTLTYEEAGDFYTDARILPKCFVARVLDIQRLHGGYCDAKKDAYKYVTNIFKTQ